MSNPRNIAGISGSNSPAGVREGTRVVLREITKSLQNSPPMHAVHRKSVSNTPPAKAEHEVKVQFTREFADVGSSSSGPESLSSASSFQSIASTISSKSSSGICIDSVPNTPQRAADTSYVNSEIPGLDELILACGNIRLGQNDSGLFPVSPNLKDSTLTVTASDSSFHLQENDQDLSQDQTFKSATDEPILDQTRDLSPIQGSDKPAHLNVTLDLSQNIQIDKGLSHQTQYTSPTLKVDNCDLNSTKYLTPVEKELCDSTALNQTRKLSSHSNTGENSPFLNDATEICTLQASDDYLTLNQTRNLSTNLDEKEIRPNLNVTTVIPNTEASGDYIALNETRNLSTNSNAGDDSPVSNRTIEISSNAKDLDNYLALNQTRNLSLNSNAGEISPDLNEVGGIFLSEKASDTSLVLNQTRDFPTKSSAQENSPALNVFTDISSNTRIPGDNFALNQNRKFSTNSNAGEDNHVLNQTIEISSNAKDPDDNLEVNCTRNLSRNSNVGEDNPVLNQTIEISSNEKHPDDYFELKQTRNLSSNSNAGGITPVLNHIRETSNANQTKDSTANLGSEIYACANRPTDSSLNLLSNGSVTDLNQANDVQTQFGSAGENTFLKEDSSINSNPLIVKSTSNQSGDVLDVKGSKSVLSGALGLNQASVSTGSVSEIGLKQTIGTPSIDVPPKLLETQNQFSDTEKPEKANFVAHTVVAEQSAEELRKENISDTSQSVLSRPLDDISAGTPEPVAAVEAKLLDAEVLEASVAKAPQNLTSEVSNNTFTQVSKEVNPEASHELIENVSCEIKPEVFNEIVPNPERPVNEDGTSELSESITPAVLPPEISEVSKSEVPEIINSEIPEVIKFESEVSVVSKSEVPKVSESEVPDVSKSQVSDLLKSEIPEVFNSKIPENSRTESPEDPRSTVPEASEPIITKVYKSDSKSEPALTKDTVEITGKEQHSPKHPQSTIPPVDKDSTDGFKKLECTEPHKLVSQDITPDISITPTKSTSNVPQQTSTESSKKAINEDPNNYLPQKQPILEQTLPTNPLPIVQEVLQRSADVQVAPIAQQNLSEHLKAEGSKSQDSPSYCPQTNVTIAVTEPQHNLDQQQEGVTDNKVTEDSGDSVEDDLDRTVTLQDLSFHSPASENGNEPYAAFKPQQQSTTLGLDCNFEKLELAAQAVATEIYNKSLELPEEADQFVTVGCDPFEDSASFDYLLARTNSKPSRDWGADSFYVKFDPLISNVSMLPKGPAQAADGEENGKNNVSAPTIGTPKRNPALAAIDRLLFYSPAMSSPLKVEEPQKMEDPVEEPPVESIPIVDATMTKELELVRTTVLQLEEQLEKQAKEHEKELEKQKVTFQEKIEQLQAQLSQEIKNKNQMTVVVDEYEKSISRLVAERERDRANLEQEKTRLQEELQAANHHLSNTEAAFNDVHLKYERLKGVVSAYKSNEDVLKESIAENVETIKALENRYDQLKSHAMSQLEKANHELEGMRKQHESEIVKLQAMLRKSDLKSNSLTEIVEQKEKENKELTQILDEVIARVGHQSD